MNPLTVTWKPHEFTSIGWDNMQTMVDAGLPNVMFSPPGDLQRQLSRLAFENLGHPFQPFIIGQRAIGPKLALLYDIRLIFYGENNAEYGNRIEDNLVPVMDPALFTCFDFLGIAVLITTCQGCRSRSSWKNCIYRPETLKAIGHLA